MAVAWRLHGGCMAAGWWRRSIRGRWLPGGYMWLRGGYVQIQNRQRPPAATRRHRDRRQPRPRWPPPPAARSIRRAAAALTSSGRLSGRSSFDSTQRSLTDGVARHGDLPGVTAVTETFR
eukprot:3719584-Prymnesium_polylepis.2